MSPEEAQSLLFEVVSASVLDRTHVLEVPGALCAVGGEREVLSARHRFEVSLGINFPAELPRVRWPTIDRFVPHVDDDKVVCYQEREGISVAFDDPADLIRECLDRAFATITRGLRGDSIADVYDELDRYWCRRPCGGRRVPTYVDADGPTREVVVGYVAKKGRSPLKLAYIADSEEAVRSFDRKHKPGKVWRGVFVRLGDSVLSDATDPRTLVTPGVLAAFLRAHVAAEDLPLVAQGWPFVTLSVPRPSGGGRTLIGLHPVPSDRAFPLRATVDARPVCLDRRDPPALLGRGGAERREREVAIIGCGAIGGHVASMLASVGVTRLTLVDPDVLSAENTFRHYLGRSALGLPKVDALQQELERRLPGLHVRPLKAEARNAVKRNRLRWNNFALVVVTIGDVPQSRIINRDLLAAGVPSVFTWLEPLGIGGHVLSRPGLQVPGCYECLFREPNGDEVLSNRADFAAAGQDFVRATAGCGGAFTQYSNLDAIRTAEMACRAILRQLQDQGALSLESWRGTADAFCATGFALTNRWHEAELDAQWFARSLCPACGRAGGTE